jgi:hypothetical protein
VAATASGSPVRPSSVPAILPESVGVVKQRWPFRRADIQPTCDLPDPSCALFGSRITRPNNHLRWHETRDWDHERTPFSDLRSPLPAPSAHTKRAHACGRLPASRRIVGCSTRRSAFQPEGVGAPACRTSPRGHRFWTRQSICRRSCQGPWARLKALRPLEPNDLGIRLIWSRLLQLLQRVT